MMKRFKHIHIIVALGLILGIVSQACDHQCIAVDCGGDDPVENLEWLNEMVHQYDTFHQRWATISRTRYEGEHYFVFGYCHPAILYVPTYTNCEGDTLDLRAENPNIDEEVYRSGNLHAVWCGSSCNCEN